MALTKPNQPLRLIQVPVPKPKPGEILVKVEACGVCRTDLHIVDNELPPPRLPLIPGHQVVGLVVEIGQNTRTDLLGRRVGIPWLGGTCGHCTFCQMGMENLCDHAKFTGYTRDGGFCEYVTANAEFVYPLPSDRPATQLAPLLCAGLIGYRAFKKASNAQRIGIYGFGAAAHILTQIASRLGREVFAFTRPGDLSTQAFARQLGATWAGDSNAMPPVKLDAAIIFAPAGELVPQALLSVRKGGIVVCGGIHMSDIPTFPYRYLWEERTITSVANLTRQDGVEFFALVSKLPVTTSVTTFKLEEANDALAVIRSGKIHGSAVLEIS